MRWVLLLLLCASPVEAQVRPADVRAAVRQIVPALRRCAEASLRHGENPSARYQSEIHIERSGRVSFAQIRGTNAPRYERCASRSLKSIRLPPQPSRLVITYPPH